MQIDKVTLRETFSRKSSDELRRIAESGEGQYTPDAVDVAHEILTGRPPEPEVSQSIPETAASVKGDRWSGIGAMLGTAYCAKALFRVWNDAEKNPQATQQALWQAATSPWTYVAVVVIGVWLWRSRKRADARAAE
jgi:hypothetical protein